MRTALIRKRFLDYFSARGHRNIPGSSLVPQTDPTLLFTNAGMVQFKDLFLGVQPADYESACSAQLCLRAGGKHNDLENVGYTARHHTLFEMLGNFSFGGYFKQEAIAYAWEFLTDSKVGLGIDPRHLWITVFGGGAVLGKAGPRIDKDDDSYRHWAACLEGAGFSKGELKRRIVRVRSSDNFWMMGDTGPCGPCSEVFYHPDKDMDRFVGHEEQHADVCVEIWNLVFMQYNRLDDGVLEPLPTPCVDTGMGLERIAAVMQGVASNYQTDLFTGLMSIVNEEIVAAGGVDAKGNYQAAHRVIADHLRACMFVISDGLVPTNEGRGYVLRRIVRRALRHAHQLGARDNCMARIAASAVAFLDDAVLARNAEHIAGILDAEETRFRLTLSQGMGMLKDFFETEPVVAGGTRQIDGKLVFLLYDTYGFPPDLTADIAREHQATVDWRGYEQQMEQQRARARKSSAFRQAAAAPVLPDGCVSEFRGYESLQAKSVVTQLLLPEQDALGVVKTVPAGSYAGVVLDVTPFYPEGGGQVGDRGALYRDEGGEPVFKVEDTVRVGEAIVHYGSALSAMDCKESVLAVVDELHRRATARNHSATHLLHASLIKTLGAHVKQKGSLVDSERLRFDFTHHEALSAQALGDIEAVVNGEIMKNSEVKVESMSQAKAAARGAIALFGEKYGDPVRVLTMGDNFSMELCGGTHVQRTGDIGMLVLTEEASVAAGVRRIEALSGDTAQRYCRQHLGLLRESARYLQCKPEALVETLKSLRSECRELKRALKQLDQAGADGPSTSQLVESLCTGAQEIKDVKVLAQRVGGVSAAVLREYVDGCRDKLGDSVVFLASEQEDRLLLASGVSRDLCARISAASLMNEFAPALGGKGGGRPDFAQGGGVEADMLESVLKKIPAWVEDQLV